MLPIDFSIDLHTHPTYKPLGKSYLNSPGEQSPDINQANSLWFYDPPSLADKLINEVHLTKFSQANLTASYYGNVMVQVFALGCIEKGFFVNKLGTGVLSDIAGDFATEISIARINAIQKMSDYFQDLKDELAFLEIMDGKQVNIDGISCCYKMVENFAQLEALVEENAGVISSEGASSPLTIAVIPTVEGLHVLNCGLDHPCDPEEVKANAWAIKKLSNKPWFVTFSHHFYNELCGHSESLPSPLDMLCDQKPGMNTGFTGLGIEVLEILLDNAGDDRILIDIKHLSPLGRKQFFEMRRNKYPDIPVIISHGVANGLPVMGAGVSDYPELGNTFNHGEINFYDNELLEMVESNGIIGLQLDEKRIASKETLKRVKHSVWTNKIMHYRSELLWKQVQYIAELFDANGYRAWDNMAVGSDYDGIVDPLNSFWTTEQYKDLKSYLERHAFNYMNEKGQGLMNAFNRIAPDVIIQKIFQENCWEFFKRWF